MEKLYSFVVFTPTYNRVNLLPRLYKSLCNQTFKDFKWLIIDDGSKDGTCDLIKKYQKENIIDIEYHYKENGGKHTAIRESEKFISPEFYNYFLGIDSDDELTKDALETFYKNWQDIDNNSLNVGIIKARTFVYGYEMPKHPFYEGVEFRDEYYHDVVFKYKVTYEMTTSMRVRDLKKYFKIPDDFWLSEKARFFPEGVLWARAGRKTKMRFLSEPLRIVHQDAGNQVTSNKTSKSVNHLYNYIIGIKYYLPENLDYILKYRPLRIIRSIVIYGTMCQLCKLKFKEYSKALSNKWLILLLLMLYPISLLGTYVYKIKKSF